MLKVLIAARNRGISGNVFPVWGLEQGIYLELSRCDRRNPNCADIKNALFAGSACLWVHSEKPLVLVLEDLHWVDPSTVDLISAVARRRAPGKLMLIGTYRPVDATVRQHPLKAVKQDLLMHHLCSEIALTPLTEAEVAEYLAIDAPAAAAPESLAALIYRIAKAIYLEAPENLRQMVELQIERLSAEEQRVLEVASLAGVSFIAKANALGIVDKEKFENVCVELSRRQHLVRRTASCAGRHRIISRTGPVLSATNLRTHCIGRFFIIGRCQSDAPGCDSASETRP